MFIITRRLENVRSVAEAARRAEAGLVPLLQATAGFRGYHIVDAGAGVGLSVTMFETREDAERVRDRAMQWVKDNLSDLYSGEPLVTACEVIYSARPEARPGAAPGAQPEAPLAH